MIQVTSNEVTAKTMMKRQGVSNNWHKQEYNENEDRSSEKQGEYTLKNKALRHMCMCMDEHTDGNCLRRHPCESRGAPSRTTMILDKVDPRHARTGPSTSRYSSTWSLLRGLKMTMYEKGILANSTVFMYDGKTSEGRRR